MDKVRGLISVFQPILGAWQIHTPRDGTENLQEGGMAQADPPLKIPSLIYLCELLDSFLSLDQIAPQLEYSFLSSKSS